MRKVTSAVNLQPKREITKKEKATSAANLDTKREHYKKGKTTIDIFMQPP